MQNRVQRALAVAAFVTCISTVGCSRTRVPSDARLIWSGEVNQPGQLWKDIHPMAAGQLYAVDHETGNVEGIDSVWEGKPTFNFNLRSQRRYDLYFVPENAPASRPAS